MWTNSNLFCTEAAAFKKQGFYIGDPFDSPNWHTYWNEQLRRCKEGYSVGGKRITGNHYFYLNFCRIMLTDEDDALIKRKTEAFPNFWDGDYEYFNIIERAEQEGKHICLLKARRRGFSWKTSAICANRYNSMRKSVTLIGASSKKYLYPEGTMSMTISQLNFLNEHTGWAKKRIVDTGSHKKSGYLQEKDGMKIEKGYQSQVIALTFNDNPDSARGKDASLIIFEEIGTWSNLMASYLATKDTVEDGIYTTGLIILGGTGGQIGEGLQDVSEIYYNPELYNVLPFDNVWEEDTRKCGFFFPDYQNKLGFIDESGNSDREKARIHEQAIRDSIARKSKDKSALISRMIEHPFGPSESLYLSVTNRFPIVDLKHRLGYLEANEKIKGADYIGNLLINEGGKITWKEDPKLYPIVDFPLRVNQASDGCVVIYNMPYTNEEGKVPYGMYLGGIDPYDHDSSQTSSLGSTLIYDKINKTIVAEYTGRPNTAKEYYENARRLLLFYNCQALYENEKKGIFDYFESKFCLYLLADEPEIIKDIIRDSRVNRYKGMHMTKGLKEYGEELIYNFLIEDRGDGTMNLQKIRSIPLLKELIAYREDLNADRVMALICVLYHEAETRKQIVKKVEEPNMILDDLFWKRNLFKKQNLDKRIFESNNF